MELVKLLVKSSVKHIMKNKAKNYSPAKGYSEFCENNVEILREEVGRLFNSGLSGENITSKIKKTYKNTWCGEN